MAQFRIIRVPLISRGIAFLRWGPLFGDSGSNIEELVEVLGAIRKEYAFRRRLTVAILPHVFQEEIAGRLLRQALLNNGFVQNVAIVPQRTFRLDLSPSLEALRKRLLQKWRNHLNAAERGGLSVVEGTSDELFGEFLAVYREMVARKKFEEGVRVEDF